MHNIEQVIPLTAKFSGLTDLQQDALTNIIGSASKLKAADDPMATNRIMAGLVLDYSNLTGQGVSLACTLWITDVLAKMGLGSNVKDALNWYGCSNEADLSDKIRPSFYVDMLILLDRAW
jgi:hypothetical protein